jgi:hypothetical protein
MQFPVGCGAACFGNWSERLAFFSLSFFLLSSTWVTFLPEGVIVGFSNVAWGFKSQKKKKNGGAFLARKLIRTIFKFLGRPSFLDTGRQPQFFEDGR